MASDYSVEICRELERKFHKAALHRPMRIRRYDKGTELAYDMTAVASPDNFRVRLRVEEFVGGGFAGQVYRVKVLDIGAKGDTRCDLEVNGLYAMKIFIPPSTFSKVFRNALYWIGFQGPFQIQVNPVAARAGALWQKFIRRGAEIRFGDARSVVDIYTTFVDKNLGSCGELTEWIEGRTWLLEVDDRIDLLKRWKRGKKVDPQLLGSPEYRSKYEFMSKFVTLLHDMGWHEFARQYEWSTWKSQPNCLKRIKGEQSAPGEMVAVDFRAGLALLPFLPMSPGDFKLIIKGLLRGSFVQFDRGDLKKLENFVKTHSEGFSGMQPLLNELKKAEEIYRDSIPDITHNHVRLLFDLRLWSTMLRSTITGWRVRNLINDTCHERMRTHNGIALLFLFIGILPLAGGILRKMCCCPDWRMHYLGIISSLEYLQRTLYAKGAESAIEWYRSGSLGAERALKVAENLWLFFFHLLLSFLPSGLHRLLTDWRYARERLDNLLVRPVRLYFNADLREQWLREMVAEGGKKRMLSNEDARTILSQINEPFIQKYLKSLAVHLCTLPVTQIVSTLVALTYVAMHPELPRAQAWGIGLGIIAFFQIIPISPGSLVRGLYVLYLVIRENNFKDYNIAVFLGFFKYIGYLAFPLQMAYRYPALARFMAGHWSTEVVHIVPVFGEHGALLEHSVFSLFYNWPLTIRRRMRKRKQMRDKLKPRYWHIGLCAIAGTAIFSLADYAFTRYSGRVPNIQDVWLIAIIIPALSGAAVTLGAGGAVFWKRIVGAAFCGCITAVLSAGSFLPVLAGAITGITDIGITCLWRVFIFAVFATLGALITEVRLPEPEMG